MPADFRAWFDAFLPDLAAGAPRSLFTPAFVSDRSDGKIAHLDGVNLSRAWCWRGLADALEPELAALARETADAHLDASLPHVAGDYMGEHWLATFALLALEGDDRGERPLSALGRTIAGLCPPGFAGGAWRGGWTAEPPALSLISQAADGAEDFRRSTRRRETCSPTR